MPVQNKRKLNNKNKAASKLNFLFSKRPLNTLHGNSWDAKHLTTFLNQSHYSNRHDCQKNKSLLSLRRIKESSTQIKCLKDQFLNKNCSKIGFTSVFQLVSNSPIIQGRQIILKQLLQRYPNTQQNERVINGRLLSLRCNPCSGFKFGSNAIKFKHTDPLTLKTQIVGQNAFTRHKKYRFIQLIKTRYPHGMMGIDHPQNPNSLYYINNQQKIKIRQEPNSHNSFVIDRDWNQKKRVNRPFDEFKNRKTITLRKFRNSNTHEFNILTNRKN